MPGDTPLAQHPRPGRARPSAWRLFGRGRADEAMQPLRIPLYSFCSSPRAMGTGHYILPSSFLSILSILSALALFFFLDFFLSILSSAILSDDILSPAVLSLAILSSGILSWAHPGTAARLASISRLNTNMIIRFLL